RASDASPGASTHSFGQFGSDTVPGRLAFRPGGIYRGGTCAACARSRDARRTTAEALAMSDFALLEAQQRALKRMLDEGSAELERASALLWDCIILGAGPAGASAAILLARS